MRLRDGNDRIAFASSGSRSGSTKSASGSGAAGTTPRRPSSAARKAIFQTHASSEPPRNESRALKGPREALLHSVARCVVAAGHRCKCVAEADVATAVDVLQRLRALIHRPREAQRARNL